MKALREFLVLVSQILSLVGCIWGFFYTVHIVRFYEDAWCKLHCVTIFGETPWWTFPMYFTGLILWILIAVLAWALLDELNPEDENDSPHS